MENVATAVINGDKTSVKERKNLAREYLALLERFERLKEDHENLQGGETKTFRAYIDYEIKDASVRDFIEYDGMVSTTSREEIRELNKILSLGMEFNRFDTFNKISGTEKAVERYISTCKLINKIQQNAYDKGLQDGKSLLVRLNDGTVALSQL